MKGAVTKPILWIHRLKDNFDGDKSPLTFHPFLGITQWLVTTGKRGRTSRMSFIFILGSENFILLRCSVTSWLRRQQPSPSSPLFVADRWSRYVFMLVWFLWGTYFLIFNHFCIHGRLSKDCSRYIHDGGCGSWGNGQAVCSLNLNFFLSFWL